MTALGLCQCGCGERTRLAPQTSRAKGWIKDVPLRYVVGHVARRSPGDYVEAACGFGTPCWLWQRSVNESGYGQCRRGRESLAHRVYYARAHGSVPAGMVIDHLCRVRRCVNPDHLEAVTIAENCRRGAKARLTRETVEAIRRSSLPAPELARSLGVGIRTVSAARAGETWGGQS